MVEMKRTDWVYDLECYWNVFLAGFLNRETKTVIVYEISDRVNDYDRLLDFVRMLQFSKSRLIGFNNIFYDYPMLHYLLTSCDRDDPELPATLKEKSNSIIHCDWSDRFAHVIWDKHCIVPQVDLFKIHHFDNDARRTSLKTIECNMRSANVEDLPYEPEKYLTHFEKDNLRVYNVHDLRETDKFCDHSVKLIEFREELTTLHDHNFINHNDTKIGKDYFAMELERLVPGSCYRYVDGRKHVRQSYRDCINVGALIFPYINFQRDEFNSIKNWLSTQVITETKGVFKGLSTEVDGFTFDFGAGGIHGSIESTTVYTDDTHIIYDWDVASYYPNLAIVNQLYPEHLGVEFCRIYKDMFDQRGQHKKGTPINSMLKLALNGVYGDSNNPYSPFYDPNYTMSITINGQLLLCMLAENLMRIPYLEMIQINTDGLTVRCPRNAVDSMNTICQWWEQFTCLTLEHAIYNRMFIRDVNNYIAEGVDGKIKTKGCYTHRTKVEYGGEWHPDTGLEWHQNHSQLIVGKAAEEFLLHGTPVEEFIRAHTNPFDFIIHTKVGRKDQLIFEQSGYTQELQRVTRYYVTTNGGALFKLSPPANNAKVDSWKRANKLTDHYYNSVIAELRLSDWLHLPEHDVDSNGLPWDERINTKNKSRYVIRKTGVNAGQLVTPCNDINAFDFSTIDYSYYINQVLKIVNPIVQNN